jgi:predicted  nucleic acid-binding Zn-ribbon protein
MSRALSLFRLQQVDSLIDHSKGRLFEIDTLLGDQTEIKDKQNQVASLESLVSKTKGELGNAEEETQNQRIKIEQVESSLYNNKQHNPKELTELQIDLVSLKNHLQVLEEKQLALMLDEEEVSIAHQLCLKELAVISSARCAREMMLVSEKKSLVREIDKLISERKAIIAPIPSEQVTQYDSLRQQKHGRAVTTVMENGCSSCGARFTAATIQASHSPISLSFCPSCGRVIYDERS